MESKNKRDKGLKMTREQIKSLFTIHTNGQDEWIRVDKRTYEKAIDKFCDAHEAKLTKACEILDGANLVEIERHFAECKAKDERIAELEAIIEKMKSCENCESHTNVGSKCLLDMEDSLECRANNYSNWKLKDNE